MQKLRIKKEKKYDNIYNNDCIYIRDNMGAIYKKYSPFN